jgi:hypothetical protein
LNQELKLELLCQYYKGTIRNPEDPINRNGRQWKAMEVKAGKSSGLFDFVEIKPKPVF